MSNSLRPQGLTSPWNSSGQNTGVGSHFLLQGSSQPRDPTQISCLADRFFTSWATREAYGSQSSLHSSDLQHAGVLLTLLFSLCYVLLFATPWTAACQASLSFTTSQSLLKLMSIGLVMPPNHLILWHSLSSSTQSFPASGSFPMSRLFTSGD